MLIKNKSLSITGISQPYHDLSEGLSLLLLPVLHLLVEALDLLPVKGRSLVALQLQRRGHRAHLGVAVLQALGVSVSLKLETTLEERNTEKR